MVVELRYGWRRRLEASLIIAASVVAGWLLFGNAGAALLALWSQQFWPRGVGERVVIDLEVIRWGRLQSARIAYARGFHVQEIFRGEISDRDYSAVCRFLKSGIQQGEAQT